MATFEVEKSATYTPEHMKQVLQEALSSPKLPMDSPLLHRRGASAQALEHSYDNSGSPSLDSDYSIVNRSDHATESTPLMSDSKNADPLKQTQSFQTPQRHGPGNRTSFTQLSSPVRLLHAPSPLRDTDLTPARTFEVEASFLQAMIGLLERQARIVPDHQLTKSEVRKIVRKELDKQKLKEGAESNQPKTLSGFVTTSWILAAAAGVAGVVLGRRAAMEYPEEVAAYVSDAAKGGLSGLIGAIALKGMLWCVDRMKIGEQTNVTELGV